MIKHPDDPLVRYARNRVLHMASIKLSSSEYNDFWKNGGGGADAIVEAMLTRFPEEPSVQELVKADTNREGV